MNKEHLFVKQVSELKYHTEKLPKRQQEKKMMGQTYKENKTCRDWKYKQKHMANRNTRWTFFKCR